MKDYSFDHQTLLNGAPVIVDMHVSFTFDIDGDWYTSFSLVAVWFDGVDVSPILDKQTLTALEMEAESAETDTRSDIPGPYPTL
jgi:hypothetical protein